MSNKQVTIQCVVVDILESNLRCLVNYKCIHGCTLNNLRTIFKNIYLLHYAKFITVSFINWL